MKRIEPYYILIACAALLLVAGTLVYALHSLSMLKGGEPIEPPAVAGEGDLFEMWFTRADLLDVNVDHNFTGIILGTGARKVCLLDRDRQLRWEKDFSTNPLQTQISACGGYLAVGTEGGDLFFMSIDSRFWWQEELGTPVNLLRLSANGRWILVGRGDPDRDTHYLELFNREGVRQWSIPTAAPLESISIAGEQLDRGEIFYTCRQKERAMTAAVSLQGEPLWEIEGAVLMALTRNENRLALIGAEGLMVYSSRGDLLWEKPLPPGFKTYSAIFNPGNDDLLLYGSDGKAAENLYCFDGEGEPLWQKRIDEGALLSFTIDGARIITCSWRQYKEDFSRIVLYDQGGAEISRWELGMRVERLLVTGNRRYIVLAGEDSYIDVVDLEATPAPGSDQNAAVASSAFHYSPVLAALKQDQNAITLFFYADPCYIPVTRLISRTRSPLRAIIEELIRGPSRESSLNRIIPKEAGVEVFFDSDSGRLHLELSPELASFFSKDLTTAVLDSLCYTLGTFSEVREIYLTADGEPLEMYGAGVALEQPLAPRHWRDPLYVPIHIEDHYYLVPREAREMQVEQRDLEGLLQAVIKQCRSFYFVPGDLELRSVSGGEDRVTIDLNGSWRLLFPENGGVEDRLHATMILDALCLTAVENSNCYRVEILVDGVDWTPPSGYPSLSRTFNQPYYVNPEF